MHATTSISLIALIVLLAYLIGSVPFAVVVSKLFGLQDPRSYGSGNPGATNVLRSGNKLAAALTLLGDALKGWVAVWLVRHIDVSSVVLAMVAFAVFIGHLYPIFLKFRGGKGVATALGVLLGFEPLLALILVLLWITVVVISRTSSLGAICAAAFAPIIYYSLGGRLWEISLPIVLVITLIGALLLIRHRANILRLLKGVEPKIGAKT